MKYYDGTKLLSMSDIDGNQPEIYLTTGNRSSGKTTYFNRLVLNRYLKQHKKFILLYRFKYELKSASERYFKDIGKLFFPEKEVYESLHPSKCITELFIRNKKSDDKCGDPIGYAIALNDADNIKKWSHFLSDADCFLFDEFQSETNNYCPNEITKFISIHQSVARGNGEMSRRVPVYMCSNTISLLNPYFVALGISDRLQNNTKFLRGKGFVLEQNFNEDAKIEQLKSAFNIAFSNDHYIAYSTQNVYLNDNLAFIEHMKGRAKYLCTIGYNDHDYCILEYQKDGIIYCSDKSDQSFLYRIAVTKEDHNINYVMLKNNELFIQNMRYYFDRGCFRFKNLACKEAILKLLSL